MYGVQGAEMNPGPRNLNLVEICMVNRIYLRQIADKNRKFLLLVLLGSAGCTAHAAPPPVPPPVAPMCPYTVKGMVVLSADSQDNPVMGPVESSNLHMCGCTDGIVRWGSYCQ